MLYAYMAKRMLISYYTNIRIVALLHTFRLCLPPKQQTKRKEMESINFFILIINQC